MWLKASASFPRVPWGALQLALVMLCSAFVVVVALLIVALEMPLVGWLTAHMPACLLDARLCALLRSRPAQHSKHWLRLQARDACMHGDWHAA